SSNVFRDDYYFSSINQKPGSFLIVFHFASMAVNSQISYMDKIFRNWNTLKIVSFTSFARRLKSCLKYLNLKLGFQQLCLFVFFFHLTLAASIEASSLQPNVSTIYSSFWKT
ncbi:hypothetical protein ACJX0J_029167, partial [Zea mays]